MEQGNWPFRQTAILGLGLMGGSLGLAIKELPKEAGATVVGWNRSGDRAVAAERRGIIDAAKDSIESACDGADLVVICTPVSTIAEIARIGSTTAAPGAVLTDVGSVKQSVVDAAEAQVAESTNFVGGHPMCGSELAGLDAARPDLYRGATWVLTPTERTDHESFSRLQSAIRTLGARVLAVDPESHDRFVAIVSHVPHLAAAALLNVAGTEASASGALLRLAAGGFRDVTRIASGSPGLWADICALNSSAISESLVLLISEIERLRDAIARGDVISVTDALEAARDARAELPALTGAGGPFFEVLVPVEDRPGILAEVSTLVGGLGINIEDISITHSVEGAKGLLVLMISGVDEATRAARGLQERGFMVSTRPADGGGSAAQRNGIEH